MESLFKVLTGFRGRIRLFCLIGIFLFNATMISLQSIKHYSGELQLLENNEALLTRNPHASLPKASLPKASSLRDASTRTSRVTSEVEQTCRVAVLNSKPTHYETLESIAAQLPLQFLHESIQDTTQCSGNIVFDYHILSKKERFESWKTYFDTSMQGETFIQEDGRRRTIGSLTLHGQLPEDGIIDPYAVPHDDGAPTNSKKSTHLKYDAVVEASCYCHTGGKKDHVEWLLKNDIRSCIFHQTCPQVSNYARAVWPSPHHEHYYIPYQLPQVKRQPDNKSKDRKNNLDLCVVGGTSRRSWDLLPSFLDSEESKQNRVRIRIFGFGPYPEELQPYQDRTTMASPVDYQEFHEEIANGCDAVLMLVTKSMNPNYFYGDDSLLKLSGVLPIVMAYQLPVVMHEEILDLYQNDLPAGLLHATHKDDSDTFVAAMKDFLPRLQKQKKKGNPD